MRLAGVLDDLQAMLVRHGEHGVHVDGQAVEVDDDDGLGLGRDRGLDLVHVQVHGVEVDVDEDGDAVVLQDAGGRGGPGVGGDDDLVARAAVAANDAHVEGGGAGVGGDGEAVAVPAGELVLEGLTVGAEGVLAAFEGGEHHLPVEIGNGRPLLDEAGGYGGRAALYREFGYCVHRSSLNAMVGAMVAPVGHRSKWSGRERVATNPETVQQHTLPTFHGLDGENGRRPELLDERPRVDRRALRHAGGRTLGPDVRIDYQCAPHSGSRRKSCPSPTVRRALAPHPLHARYGKEVDPDTAQGEGRR